MVTKIFSEDEQMNEARLMRALYMGIAMHALISTMIRGTDGALTFNGDNLAENARQVADAMVRELSK